MAETRIDLYEGLFLLNYQHSSADLGACMDFLKEVFNRAEAEVLVLRRWDDRKLAYEIKGQKRGVYVIAYFKSRRSQIANIERDCNLSEQVVRTLIIRADHLGEVELELAKQEAVAPAPSAPAPAAVESAEATEAPAQA
jgi:small subunit ribosomal protein S6